MLSAASLSQLPTQQTSDLGRPSGSIRVKTKVLPGRLASFEVPAGTIELPRPRRCLSQGALLPPPSLTATATPSSSAASAPRSWKEQGWNELFAASSLPSRMGTQSSRQGPCSEPGLARNPPRWEPHLTFGEVLPRPRAPLRRCSSTPAQGLLDSLVCAAEEAAAEQATEPKHSAWAWPQLKRSGPVQVEGPRPEPMARFRPLSDVFDQFLERPAKLKQRKQAWNDVLAGSKIDLPVDKAFAKLREVMPALQDDPHVQPLQDLHRGHEGGSPVPILEPPRLSPVSEPRTPGMLEAESRPDIAKAKDASPVRPLGVPSAAKSPEAMWHPDVEADKLIDMAPEEPLAPPEDMSSTTEEDQEPRDLPMPQDLSRLVPLKPPTLDDTLQDMAMAIANADSILLSSHPQCYEEPRPRPQPTKATRPESDEISGRPAKTRDAEDAGDVGQRAKTAVMPDTPDTASVLSRSSKKEIDDVHSTDSSALSRFLAARRISTSSAGVTPPRAQDSPTQRAKNQKDSRTPRVGPSPLYSDEESNVLSDVSFFGQSSVADPVQQGSRQSSKSSAGPPRPSASGQALAASTAVAHARGVDCALCGRKGICTDGNCFCPDCSQRMSLLDAPTSASERDSTRKAPAKHRGSRSRRSSRSGSVASGSASIQEASCVLCSEKFICEDRSQSSVLCPQCLAQH